MPSDAIVYRSRRQQNAPERGQSLVEFALAMPLLALVVFAIFEFGNLLRVQIELQNAVREGARFAALGGPASYHGTSVTGGGTSGCPSSSDIQTVVRGATDSLPITVTSSYSPSPCSTACGGPSALPELTVSGTYTYTPVTPVGTLFTWFSGSFASSISLSSHATVYFENCF